MIKLYTWPSPNGRKVAIALEELGLEYQVVQVNLDEQEQFSDEFLALNPNNKIPVLEDDGVVIFESGAIMLHLAEKYGELLPTDPVNRIHAIQWAFFQASSIGPNLGRLASQVVFREPEERNQEMVEIFTAEVDRLIGVIERHLSDGREYLAREYSIADIMHYPWLWFLLDAGNEMLTRRELTVEWLERIGQLPAVKRGMEVPPA